MCPDQHKTIAKKMRGCHAQQGFAIVAAIFLLVVLAALGAFMVTFSTVQHTTSAQDLQGVRAYQAARAGIEWGAYQVLTPVPPATCPAPATLPILAGTLASFTVTVQCQPFSYTEGTNTVTVYKITSTAWEGSVGSTKYVERQLQATLSK